MSHIPSISASVHQHSIPTGLSHHCRSLFQRWYSQRWENLLPGNQWSAASATGWWRCGFIFPQLCRTIQRQVFVHSHLDWRGIQCSQSRKGVITLLLVIKRGNRKYHNLCWWVHLLSYYLYTDRLACWVSNTKYVETHFKWSRLGNTIDSIDDEKCYLPVKTIPTEVHIPRILWNFDFHFR